MKKKRANSSRAIASASDKAFFASKAAGWLIISAALLFAMGLLMVFNTTSAEVIDRSLNMSTHAAFFKQLFYAVVGVGLGLLVYWVGYERLIQRSPSVFILMCVLLLSVFIPGIGIKINGASRWIGVGGIPIGQPSECMKLILPISYIYWFLKVTKPIELSSFLKELGFLFIPIALILFEPDNGTALILFLELIVLFFLSKIRWVYWALPLTILAGAGILAASQMPHVQKRIEIYLHPESDLKGKGHQPYQAKIATGSGKLWGRGLGESLQKLNYLPEARSDYIAAIFAEELGFLGMIGLMALYIILIASGFIIALHSENLKAFLLASMISFLIGIETFFNLGVVSGLLPSKGTTLPFFSQGGSSLMIHIAALFLLLDIARKRQCLKL